MARDGDDDHGRDSGANDGLGNGQQQQQTAPWETIFRCRHLQAISLRNLFLPINDNQHHRPSGIGPDLELGQIVSDEEAVSSGDDEPGGGDGDGDSGSRNASPDQPDSMDAPVVLKSRQNGKAVPPSSPPSQRKCPPVMRHDSRSMSTALAAARQQAYEARILSRRLTLFFTLHCLGPASKVNEEPIYVSEVQEQAMNPDFRPFMTNDIQDQSFLRGRLLAIRVWAKTVEDEQYSLLLEEKTALPELYFVTRDLDYAYGAFRDNTVLYHLPDGIYTSYSDPSFERRLHRGLRSKGLESKTASFNVLMKLRTLIEVIDDATATQQKIAAQISTLLDPSSDRATIARAASATQSVQAVHESAAALDREVARLRQTRAARQKHRQSHTDALVRARKDLSNQRSIPSSLRTQIAGTRAQTTDLSPPLRSHAARIAEDLLSIFPIEPLPASPLSFTIRGCHVPHARAFETGNTSSMGGGGGSGGGSTVHQQYDDSEVAAGLGYVALVVNQLSRMLLHHVPYPLQYLGSGSTVRDEITWSGELERSRLLLPGSGSRDTHASAKGQGEGQDGARTFPLYAHSADPARFRYAVYLLNRDVEELVTKQGLRVVDARDTLANLGFLLNAVASGMARAELPKRMAGRVAGLQKRDGS